MLIKALTICQPYASLIANPPHHKRVENRSWKTSYRGPLIIHAGMSKRWLKSWDGELPEPMPFGKVLGICLVDDIVSQNTALYLNRDGEYGDNEHIEGPYCWMLSNIRTLNEPVAIAGSQGLWNLDTEKIGISDRRVIEGFCDVIDG